MSNQSDIQNPNPAIKTVVKQPSAEASKILLTGAAGFIGAKVAELLLNSGYIVVGVDNLNDAYDVRLKHWRLEQLNGQPNFHFHQLDITNRQALDDLFQTYANGTIQTTETAADNGLWSAVINLAARAGVRQSVENPWVYVDTNVTGTLNLLELCRQFGVKKFVLASTSSLYGANNPRPFSEAANTDGPLSPYAASKKAAEAMCFSYHYLYDLDVTVLRFFTVYGPAGRPDMSLFRFVQWISEGRPVTIFGDGRQSRDFTYVEDIACGVVAALRPLGYEVINLGSDTPVVLLDAVRLVEELLEKPANLNFVPRHPADVTATWADIGKAKRLLDWQPQASFEQGVARLVEWYQTNREWAREIVT